MRYVSWQKPDLDAVHVKRGHLVTVSQGKLLKTWSSHWVTLSESGVSSTLRIVSLYHLASWPALGAKKLTSHEWGWAAVLGGHGSWLVLEIFFPVAESPAVSEASASRLFFPPDDDDNVVLFWGTFSAFVVLRGFCAGNWAKTSVAFLRSQVGNKHQQRCDCLHRLCCINSEK